MSDLQGILHGRKTGYLGMAALLFILTLFLLPKDISLGKAKPHSVAAPQQAHIHDFVPPDGVYPFNGYSQV